MLCYVIIVCMLCVVFVCVVYCYWFVLSGWTSISKKKEACFGWHYLPNATCLLRPRPFYARFVASRIAMSLKKTCVGQVALDKRFSLIAFAKFVAAGADGGHAAKGRAGEEWGRAEQGRP